MTNVKEVVGKVRDAMIARLSFLVSEALADASMAIANEPASKRTRDLNLIEQREAIVERFASNMRSNFDQLTGVVNKDVNVLDYGSLSLVEEADLEAIIAMEGMISHARNCDISEYLSFSTRLDSLFFGMRIDESNNPMDPEQLGEAFRDSLQPVGMTAVELLVSYRKFNKSVFHGLEKVLIEANGVLIAHDVLPNLDMAARSRREQQNKRSARPERVDPTDRAFDAVASDGAPAPVGDQQLLGIMQKLLHSIPSQKDGSSLQSPQPSALAALPGTAQTGMMIGKQRVELVASDQLLALLGKLQSAAGSAGEGAAEQPPNLAESVGSLLEQQSSGDTLRAIDSQSSDIINLVTILFEEIWNDRTLPLPIKELLGRTQITILKIALADPAFFDSTDHPARTFLNEIAATGISWTGTQQLDDDPLYQKLQDLVRHVVREYSGDIAAIKQTLADFVDYRAEHEASNKAQERQLLDEDERGNRLEEIEQYTRYKIEERILDAGIDPYVRDFLLTHFKKFVVQIVLREGPGGVSWRPIMNTIDVLLWTVSREKQDGDRQRYVKVNPRLMLNLGKALGAAGIEKAEADEALRKLQEVQEACFRNADAQADEPDAAEAGPESEDVAQQASAGSGETKLPPDDEHLREVSQYPIGVWLEFEVQGGQSIRCTLAARIDTIEKYVFVNAQGVKVVEKSRVGLAKELKAGTVKVICGAPLVDRAMESVMARLRSARENQAA